MTVLLTTHYLEEADGCDQVAFIKSGRIVQRGTPAALVDALGRHIIEIEAEQLGALTASLEPQLGRRSPTVA
jgi:ABC-2 type transport system ATP-binding protein